MSTTSAAGVKFIADFEGFRSRPYRDAVGVWTIGFGHTGGVGPGTRPLSQSEGRHLLARDLRRFEGSVNALRLPLNQKQFDALVSFAFNLGPLYLRPGHTMGDALRRRDWGAAANAFLLYDKAAGHSLSGLTRRRRAERALFLSAPLNPIAHKLAKWRAELAHRRAQLRVEKKPGARAFLTRRIGELARAIRKHR